MSEEMGYFSASFSALSNFTGTAGGVESAMFREYPGVTPTREDAYVPMMAAEDGSTSSESTREFHTLLSGNTGHPAILRVFWKTCVFCCPAAVQVYRPAPSRVHAFMRSG